MTALLKLSGASKKFGGLVAVNNVSFGVEKGESLGLIGPNGAGKTTTFSILMGEHRPDSGSVEFRGQTITKVPTHRRVQMGIARTHQIPRPFGEMDVFENVRVGSMPDSVWRLIAEKEPERDEWEIIKSVGFGEREAGMLPGQLSMGELRKLELARTLAAGPEVLLLDEVFAGLTVGEIAQLTDLLLERKKLGMTYMIVSHDLRSLKPLVDRVIVMSFGSLIAEGEFDDVMADEGVREAYLGQARFDE
ncbi:MAG: ABC transporter ATP-binding protein [Albidovulum sp.]|nr:ABC transporter ATP-binding protein [Albidovulum sp.]